MLSAHRSSTELAERLGARAASCTVVSARPICVSLHEVVLHGDPRLAGVPGNDVMVRVRHDGHHVRRRYTVRSVDYDNHRFSIWVSTDHVGAGSTWAQSAAAGDAVDVIGPRGKITLAESADWHLFIGDVSGLAAFYRLAQSIETPGRAIFIVEIDQDDDALTADFDEGLGVTGIFVDRRDRLRNDPAGLLSGLSAFAFPPDQGHAYVLGEFSVVRAVRDALRDRGLRDHDISHKAYWRLGRANADHGEPDKSDS